MYNKLTPEVQSFFAMSNMRVSPLYELERVDGNTMNFVPEPIPWPDPQEEHWGIQYQIPRGRGRGRGGRRGGRGGGRGGGRPA